MHRDTTVVSPCSMSSIAGRRDRNDRNTPSPAAPRLEASSPRIAPDTPESPKCGHRVGRREGDPSRGVDQQHAVADPGTAGRQHLLVGERELAGGDHGRQAVEDLQVGTRQVAGRAGQCERRLTGHDRHHLVPWCITGTAVTFTCWPSHSESTTSSMISRVGRGACHQGPLLVVDRSPDHVLLEEGLAGVGSDLVHHQEPAAAPGLLGQGT